MKQKFHLGDILSVITGTRLWKKEMQGMHKLMEFLVGQELFIHQLPTHQKKCRQWLLHLHPSLAKVDAREVNKENFEVWLASKEKEHGEMLEVWPIKEKE